MWWEKRKRSDFYAVHHFYDIKNIHDFIHKILIIIIKNNWIQSPKKETAMTQFELEEQLDIRQRRKAEEYLRTRTEKLRTQLNLAYYNEAVRTAWFTRSVWSTFDRRHHQNTEKSIILYSKYTEILENILLNMNKLHLIKFRNLFLIFALSGDFICFIVIQLSKIIEKCENYRSSVSKIIQWKTSPFVSSMVRYNNFLPSLDPQIIMFWVALRGSSVSNNNPLACLQGPTKVALLKLR